MELESIKELAQKVKRLADEGASEGERNAAQNALNRLLARHNLTLEDITLESRFIYTIQIGKGNELMRRLWMQIIAALAPKAFESLKINNRYGKNITWNASFTKTEWADVKDALVHYENDFNKQVDVFYGAYIQKNKLFASIGVSKQLSSDEMDKMKRAMDAIDENSRLKKLNN